MKICVLMENTACCEGIEAEHGLSLYIEAGGRRVLADMGQTDAFARNAERMGVDLTRVDAAVLSHGHYDHGGGLERFLQINGHAPVYVSPHAFGSHYNGTEKYIGLSPALQGHARLIEAEDGRQILPGATLYDGASRKLVQPVRSHGLNRLLGGRFVPDDFLHEQYLLIEERGKRVLVSGCSHRGIVNIVAWFRPDVLIGGFHLMKETDEEALARTADALMAAGTLYYTGHCTGEAQYAFLKARMGDRLQAIHAGSCFEV